MAAKVYSTRLGQAHNFTGEFVIACADGVLTILRDIDVYAPTSIEDGTIEVRGALGQVIFASSTEIVLGSGGFAWRGRQVLYPGETITVEADVIGWDFTLSGYELTLP